MSNKLHYLLNLWLETQNIKNLNDYHLHQHDSLVFKYPLYNQLNAIKWHKNKYLHTVLQLIKDL